ncbi:hypothetical protein QBC47DRAFT_284888, partial [Echria macrotheca]
CWVLPQRFSAPTLRSALCSLQLTCCWSRASGDCKGFARHVAVGGLTSRFRQFYNGQPIWEVDGNHVLRHPG